MSGLTTATTLPQGDTTAVTTTSTTGGLFGYDDDDVVDLTPRRTSRGRYWYMLSCSILYPKVGNNNNNIVDHWLAVCSMINPITSTTTTSVCRNHSSSFCVISSTSITRVS